MRKSDVERLKSMVAGSADKFDRSPAYEAIAFAERDEKDPKAQQILHEASLEFLHGHLDKVQEMLDSIETTAE